MRNEDICESLGQVAVVGIMRERQKKWKAKLEQVYEDDVVGNRPRE